ncbi:MAG TPA: phospholipase [Rhodospirillaceae bacterium]|nr:phospholipase [Rhodospirillaceae bacterium]
MLHDVVVKPADGQIVRRAVIILHGLGDSADGIISLAEVFRPALPDTEFLAPDAPFPCDFSPFGFQWFSADDWTSSVVLNGVEKAAAPLNAYIDHVMESRNLTADKIALLGFSQGTMMGLYVAPRRKKQLAGVLGYSGALVGAETLSRERESSPPIMLVHGTNDEVVPFVSMNKAVEGLRNVNMNVSTVPCPNLGHSIDDNGITHGVMFLRKVFQL